MDFSASISPDMGVTPNIGFFRLGDGISACHMHHQITAQMRRLDRMTYRIPPLARVPLPKGVLDKLQTRAIGEIDKNNCIILLLFNSLNAVLCTQAKHCTTNMFSVLQHAKTIRFMASCLLSNASAVLAPEFCTSIFTTWFSYDCKPASYCSNQHN